MWALKQHVKQFTVLNCNNHGWQIKLAIQYLTGMHCLISVVWNSKILASSHGCLCVRCMLLTIGTSEREYH